MVELTVKDFELIFKVDELGQSLRDAKSTSFYEKGWRRFYC